MKSKDIDIRKMKLEDVAAPLYKGLPKIHKEGVPLRPIVSGFKAPTRRLADWLKKQVPSTICQLYTQIPVDQETAKEVLVRSNMSSNHQEELERLIKSEMVSGGVVVASKQLSKMVQAASPSLVLVSKLLRLYLSQGKLQEAYTLGLEENKKYSDPSLAWYSLLVEICKAYAEKQATRVDLAFYTHYLHILNKAVSLAFAEPQTRIDKGSASFSSSLLHLMDQVVYLAAHHQQTKPPAYEGWPYFLTQMKGQLYFHLAGLVLRGSTRERGRDIQRLGASLLLVAYCFKPGRIGQEAWFHSSSEHHQLLVEVYRLSVTRHLQAALVLNTLAAHEDPRLWISKIKSECCIPQVQERIYHRTFESSNPKLSSTSFFLTDPAYTESTLEYPHLASLQESFQEAQQVHAASLHHLVWLALSARTSATRLPFPFQLFSSLHYSCRNLGNGSPESLCQLDMETFLHATMYCAQAALDRRGALIAPQAAQAPLSVPPDIAQPLCTPQQSVWWEAAHSLVNNVARYSKWCHREKMSSLRRILQQGLEVVRGVGNHGLEVSLVVHLSRVYADKVSNTALVTDAKEQGKDTTALEARAAHYWELALELVAKLEKGGTLRKPRDPLFPPSGAALPGPEELAALRDEGELYLALYAMNQGRLEEAAAKFDKLSSPHASYYEAQCLKQLESKPGGCQEKSAELLSRARNSLYLTLDRLRGDPDHHLNKEVPRMLEELEARQGGRHVVDAGSDDTTEESVAASPTQSSCPKNISQSYYTPPSRPRKPNMDKLESQLKALTISQETMNKTLIEQNKCLVDNTKAILEEIKQISSSIVQVELQLTDLRDLANSLKKVGKMPLEDDLDDFADEELNETGGHDWMYHNGATMMLPPEYRPNYPPPGAPHLGPDLGYSPLCPPPTYHHYPGVPLAPRPPPQRSSCYPPLSSAGLHFTEGQQLPQFQFQPASSYPPPPEPKAFTPTSKPHSFQIPMPVVSSSPPGANLPPSFLQSTSTLPAPIQASPLQPAPFFSPPQKSERQRMDSEVSDTQEPSHDPFPDYKPLVPLPDKVDVHTGEEEESVSYLETLGYTKTAFYNLTFSQFMVIFEERAKLFRMVDKEWKERGVGTVKILKNESGKYRLVMRRDQVFKICANHCINEEMQLMSMSNNDKAWIWAAQDYADEVVQQERFCIRFKTAELAIGFKEAVDKCIAAIKEAPSITPAATKPVSLPPTSFDPAFLPKPGSWNCPTCLLNNSEGQISCVACTTPKPGASPLKVAAALSKSWTCKLCHRSHSDDKTICEGCNSFRPNEKKDSDSPFSGTVAKLSFGGGETSREGGDVFAKLAATKATSSPDSKPLFGQNLFGSNKPLLGQTPVMSEKPAVFGQPPASSDKPIFGTSPFGALANKPIFGQSSFATSETTSDKPGYPKCPFTTGKTKSNYGPQLFPPNLNPGPDIPPVLAIHPPPEKPLLSDSPFVFFGPTSQSSTFGQTASSADKPIFGQTASSADKPIFGQTASSADKPIFGQTASSADKPIFGQTASSADKTIFGQMASADKPIFGQTASSADKPIFGQTASSVGKPIFGQIVSSADKPIFGQTPIFGEASGSKPSGDPTSEKVPSTPAKDQQPPLLFGKVQPIFGQATPPVFGQGSSIFGQFSSTPKTETGLLGAMSSFGFKESVALSTPGKDESVSTALSTETTPVSGRDIKLSSKSTKQEPTEPKANPFSKFSFSTTPKSTGAIILEEKKESKSEPHVTLTVATTPVVKVQPQGDITPEKKDDAVEEFVPTAEFQPVVPLPELADLKTGEEDEEVMFSSKAKLFRYDSEGKQWKEKGRGEMKILKNLKTGKYRILMRRDQVLKVCANHLITPDMKLQVLQSSETSWVWDAVNMEDDEMKPEKLAVRFGNKEIAQKFKKVFEECQKETPKQAGDSPGTSQDTWECPTCLSKNETASSTCNTCTAPKADEAQGQIPLSQLFKPEEGSWECPDCYLRNAAKDVVCLACGCVKPGHSKPPPAAAAAPSSQEPVFKFGCSSDFSFGTSNKDGFVFGQIPESKPTEVPGNFVFGSYSKVQESQAVSPQNFKFGSPQKYSFNFEVAKSPVKSPDISREEDESGEISETDITFKPVIPLPPKVDAKTGEEDEQVLYSHRAKLFRYCDGEWKERGIGDVKILRHPETGRLRLLMRRDQILKLCLNHLLPASTGFVSKGEKAWTWAANDYSDLDEPGQETHFTLRFKSAEIAQEFKVALDDAMEGKTPSSYTHSQGASPASKPLGTSPDKAKESDEGLDAEVVITYEKTASSEQVERALALQLPKNFYLYETAPPCPGCRGCRDELPAGVTGKGKECLSHHGSALLLPFTAEPSVEADKKSSPPPSEPVVPAAAPESPSVKQQEVDQASIFEKKGMSFADLVKQNSGQDFTAQAVKNASFNFPGAGQQVFGSSPQAAAQAEDEVAPSNDPHFEPIIPLPDLVEVRTGEEDEVPIFSERAKLFRFDAPTQQWKERGVGEMKILQHSQQCRYRLIMRRDQVHKVVCNHLIVEGTQLSPMATSNNSLCWVARDFSEDPQGTLEKFAIRFKVNYHLIKSSCKLG
ncbi:RANBP2 [Cordylochernes scorpioides]|uniref:RANBP2 n=1 Tax=Cordylochernes scorpioides TaxID=51811 RepID=A0ABY6L8N4_9ARAC|nr:RANBP2 [Cordylochernes scorpioides]